MVNIKDYFNSQTIRGRANVAKVTYASLALVYIYYRMRRRGKKSAPPPKTIQPPPPPLGPPKPRCSALEPAGAGAAAGAAAGTAAGAAVGEAKKNCPELPSCPPHSNPAAKAKSGCSAAGEAGSRCGLGAAVGSVGLGPIGETVTSGRCLTGQPEAPGSHAKCKSGTPGADAAAAARTECPNCPKCPECPKCPPSQKAAPAPDAGTKSTADAESEAKAKSKAKPYFGAGGVFGRAGVAGAASSDWKKKREAKPLFSDCDKRVKEKIPPDVDTTDPIALGRFRGANDP